METSAHQKKPLGTYSHNPSVLLQFLLHEFIQAFGLVQEIKHLLKKKRLDATSLEKISKILAKMLGPVREEHDFFTWTDKSGAVRVFGHYCYVLCEYEEQICLESQELLRVVTLSMHDYILCQELLRQGATSLTTAGQQLTQLLRQLERATSSFARGAEIIPEIVYRYRKDENVLFYLLRHGEQIDFLFNPGFLRDLFKKCYPKGGIEKAKTYIISRYKARGFTQLTPQISEYIEQIS